MSHRTPLPPPSPALSPSLYSGMSSLQIDQAGPGPLSRSSYRPSASQPQKALLKGPKTARHQSRKNEHPSSSAPWKDLRKAAAASSGHKRIVKEDESYRRIQTSWSPFPPDTRAITRKEDDVMVRAMANHIRQTDALGNQIYEEKYGDAERRVDALRAEAAERMRIHQFNESVRRDREPFMLWCVETAPNEKIRQHSQACLDEYYEDQRRQAALGNTGTRYSS